MYWPRQPVETASGDQMATSSLLRIVGSGRLLPPEADPGPVTVVERAKGEIRHQRPLLLPDGKTLLYTIWYGPGWDEQEVVGAAVWPAEKTPPCHEGPAWRATHRLGI